MQNGMEVLNAAAAAANAAAAAAPGKKNIKQDWKAFQPPRRLKDWQNWHTVLADWDETLTQEERRFLYFNHLSQEFLEQMIPHLKAFM